MIFLSYIFVIGGTSFCLYSFYSCIVRYIKIKNLPEEIINQEDKEKYLKTLYKYASITGACSFFSFICILLKSLELRLVLPVMSIIIASYIFQGLIDEIIDFDISKKDSDILFDFLNSRKKDAEEKAKENKITKIDSFDGCNQNFSDLDNEKEDK